MVFVGILMWTQISAASRVSISVFLHSCYWSTTVYHRQLLSELTGRHVAQRLAWPAECMPWMCLSFLHSSCRSLPVPRLSAPQVQCLMAIHTGYLGAMRIPERNRNLFTYSDSLHSTYPEGPSLNQWNGNSFTSVDRKWNFLSLWFQGI